MSAQPIIAFDGEIGVQYGFLFLGSGQDEQPELISARGGQANGICAAAFPEMLSMVTGLHSGSVPIRVEVWRAPPSPAGDWQEVVETPFVAVDSKLSMWGFDSAVAVDLPEPGDYRARWSAFGMDAAHELNYRAEGDPALDRYLLQLWPAPPKPGRIVRQTSEMARYWHQVAFETPAPAGPLTRAEREVAQAVRREQEQQANAAALELSSWDGTLPSPELRRIGGRATVLARLDRELAERLAHADAERQRAVAAWAARLACARAGIDEIVWIVPGLAALDGGAPLPPPFDDRAAVWRLLFAGPSKATVRIGPVSADRPVLDPRAVALDALLSAGNSDPAAAAFDAVAVLTAGPPIEFLPGLRAVV